MGKFVRACCRRETYAVLVGIAFCCFAILALALPWFGIAATELPKPWDSMTIAFYWGGFEGLYSPPLVGNQRSYSIPWGSMTSTIPKDVYMTSMAMTFLGLFSMMLIMGLNLFGFIFPKTERVVQMMFFGYFKWIVVIVCFANWGVMTLAWTIFFAFPSALGHADLCPGSTHYTPAPFPFVNGTRYFDRLWCDSFANNRYSFDGARYIWAPSLGWIFSLVAYFLSNVVLFIMLSVPTKNSDKDYERIKDGK